MATTRTFTGTEARRLLRARHAQPRLRLYHAWLVETRAKVPDGSATAQALARAGWRVDCVPATFGAAGLLEAFAVEGVAEARMLLPASAVARVPGAAAYRTGTGARARR